MNKRWFRRLLERRILVILLLLVQLIFLIGLILSSSQTYRIINWVLTAVSIGVALYIISKKDKGAFKLTWIMLILIFPLFGGLLYLIFNFQTSTRRFSASIQKAEKKAAPLFSLPGDGHADAAELIPDEMPQIDYL